MARVSKVGVAVYIHWTLRMCRRVVGRKCQAGNTVGARMKMITFLQRTRCRSVIEKLGERANERTRLANIVCVQFAIIVAVEFGLQLGSTTFCDYP